MKRVTLIALCVFALFALPAQARTVTLAISPAAPSVGDHAFFSGCGYGANKDVSVFAQAPGAVQAVFEIGVRADAFGCFTTAIDPIYRYNGYLISASGDYDFYVFYKHGSGVSDYGNGQPVAELEIEVVG